MKMNFLNSSYLFNNAALISIVLHRDLSTTSNIKAMRLMVLSYPLANGIYR